MSSLTRLARRLLPPLLTDGVRGWRRRREPDPASHFEAAGRIPFTHGYHAAKERLIRASLADEALLRRFASGSTLPERYGIGLDERVVEYPWLVASLPPGPARLLDAGSALNHAFILGHPRLAEKQTTILTLAPEEHCFWRLAVSYVFDDLRRMPFPDALFEIVVSVSTLEHVGFDNTSFTGDAMHRERRPDDHKLALAEIRRVLGSRGQLLLTLPFGRHQAFAGFMTFDPPRLAAALEAFGPHRERGRRYFLYTASGWSVAGEAAAAEAEYVSWSAAPQASWPRPVPVEPDRAAAARAVVCLWLEKS